MHRNAWLVLGLLAACGPNDSWHRAVALDALARDSGVESPRAIVAALSVDPLCPAVSLEIRVRCHLARAQVSVARVRDGWLVVFTMPELSDHVHRVWLRSGKVSVEVESEN